MSTPRPRTIALGIALAIALSLPSLAAPTAARADDTGPPVFGAALQLGLQALRDNADSVGLDHLAATAALAEAHDALPLRTEAQDAPVVPPLGVLFTPAR
jgi:hypothetical protein